MKKDHTLTSFSYFAFNSSASRTQCCFSYRNNLCHHKQFTKKFVRFCVKCVKMLEITKKPDNMFKKCVEIRREEEARNTCSSLTMVSRACATLELKQSNWINTKCKLFWFNKCSMLTIMTLLVERWTLFWHYLSYLLRKGVSALRWLH